MARKSPSGSRSRKTASAGDRTSPHDKVSALFARGLACHQQGDFDTAAELYQEVLAHDAKHFGATHLLGVVAHQQGRHEEAVERITRALEIDPGVATAYSNLGVALKKLGRFEAARASYEHALAIKPDYAEAHYNLGLTLQEMGLPQEALACYDRALSHKPDYADAHNNRGLMLHRLGNLLQAVQSFERAIALRPDYYEVHSNLGLAWQELGHINDAMASFERAIALRPEMAEAYWNKSLALLVSGQLEVAWPLYERGLECGQRGSARAFNQPAWRGDISLLGKTILLYAEQGLGDTIQFCRYAAMVKALGGRVIMEVQAPLVNLLRGLAGVDEIIAAGQPLPAFDLQCPLLSLPLAFKTSLNTIPSATPYLHAQPDKMRAWRARLDSALGVSHRPRIGLVWSGNAGHKNDHNRSIALATLLASLPEGVDYVSLQREVRESDLACLKSSRIAHFGETLEDFSDTAALCEAVDLVLSVDTSVAHLAGALGKPTWVLLPHAPDWRWLLERDDSPWYPGMRLLRQDASGGWQPVLERVAQTLSAQSIAQALFKQGLAQHKLGALEAAAGFYERVLALDPTHFDANHMLGVIAHQQGRNADAVQRIEHALQINPKVASAHSNLGIALKKLCRYEEAVRSYD